MLLAILKVVLLLAAACLAWFLVAGAVLDRLFGRAAARHHRDDEPHPTPPPGAGPGPLR